jgi:AcrR family transcriptional regulator
MRQTKTDRRSQRTRYQLMHSLIALIKVKRYDSITVQQITDHANVGRSTFYAHFTDKDDLLLDGVREMVANLETGEPGTDTLGLSLGLFHHVGDNADLHFVLTKGRALGLFLAVLQEELTGLFSERLAARVKPGTKPAVPVPLLAAMIASMLITAIRTWLDAGLRPTAETVNRAFTVAAKAAIHAGLAPATG